MTLRLTLLLPVLGFITLTGCSTSTSSLKDEEGAPSAGPMAKRVRATVVHFEKWGDTLQIDAGATWADGTCRFLDPIVDDSSTRWKPFQVYWAIFDDADDVTHGQVIRDIFFQGDKVESSEFPGSKGLAYLNTTFASMLPLEGFQIGESRTWIQGRMGSPFNAILRVQLRRTEDGCESYASYCPYSTGCASNDLFRPLNSIYVEQNFFNYPTRVTYR